MSHKRQYYCFNLDCLWIDLFSLGLTPDDFRLMIHGVLYYTWLTEALTACSLATQLFFKMNVDSENCVLKDELGNTI